MGELQEPADAAEARPPLLLLLFCILELLKPNVLTARPAAPKPNSFRNSRRLILVSIILMSCHLHIKLLLEKKGHNSPYATQISLISLNRDHNFPINGHDGSFLLRKRDINYSFAAF